MSKYVHQGKKRICNTIFTSKALGSLSAFQSADIHFQNHLGVTFVDFQVGVSKPTLVQAQALLFFTFRQMFFFYLT